MTLGDKVIAFMVVIVAVWFLVTLIDDSNDTDGWA